MRKMIKKQARERLKKHYWIFMFLCLLTGFIGIDYSTSLTIFKTNSQTNAVVNPSKIGEVFEDLIFGDIQKGENVSQEFIEKQKKQTEMYGDIALGHTRGVFAELVNNVSSGQILLTIYQTLHSLGNTNTFIALVLILLAFLFYMGTRLLIINPFHVTLKRYFMEARLYDHVPAGRFLYLIHTKKLLHVSKVMMIKDIFQTLWSITIIGGMIKPFSYQMVPYILAENPTISTKDAITLSRKMMYGHKWEAFKLELSFLGWHILTMLSWGLSGIFYSNPYHESVLAEYYNYVRKCAQENEVPGIELLNDIYLYEKAEASLLLTEYKEFQDKLNAAKTEIIYHTGLRGFLENTIGVTFTYDDDEKQYEKIKAIKGYVQNIEYVVEGNMYPSRLHPIKVTSKPKEIKSLHYDRHYSILSIIFLFFSICLIGWSWEVCLHLITDGEFVNRGVLHGPWLPIYGFGGVFILMALYRLRRNPFVLFLSAVVLCGALEYFTHYLMEIIHNGQRWWDYTGYFLNINGRICGEGLLVFGLGGIAIVYFVAPLFDNYFRKIPLKIGLPIGVALMLIFTADFIYSNKHPNVGKGITDYESELVLPEDSMQIVVSEELFSDTDITFPYEGGYTPC